MEPKAWVSRLAISLALALAFLFLTLELNTFLSQFVPALRAGGISILWSIFALGLILAGIRRQEGLLRYVGLGLFTVVGFKVFFSDLASLDQFYRIIAFILLGVLMLCWRVPLPQVPSDLREPASRGRRRGEVMKLHSSLILIICLVFPHPGSAAGPPFRFRKDIDGQTAAEEIMAVVLDPEVHAATRDGYPDLRILDEAGAEVPFLLEQAKHREIVKVREACPSDVVSLRDRDGKSLEIVVQLREKAPNADGLTIVTPLTDYEHRREGLRRGGRSRLVHRW